MLRICTIIAFVLAVLLAFANSSLYDWPTGDEHWHYQYSRRLFEEGLTERESVHNFNSTTPFVLLNVLLEEAATDLGVVSGFDKLVARLPAVGWYVLLLLLSYSCARYLFKRIDPQHAGTAAFWTALLTCLDETLLGQGSHIGSDVPFAAMTLVFLMALEHYRRAPGLKAAAILGTALGVALNVKYSATFLLLFGIVAMLVMSLRHRRENGAAFSRVARDLLVQYAMIGAIVSVMVNAAYGFKDVGLTFASKEWYSPPFKLLASAIPNVPLPWPLPFIAGFDHQFAAERTWSWNSILLGQEFPDGAWFYFPLVWLLKTPLPLIAATILGLALAFRHFSSLRRNGPFVLTSLLLAFLLGYFCFVFRTQVGIRYTLMCLPLAYLLIGYLFATGLRGAEQGLVAVFVLVGTAYEAAPFFGNNLSFTNSILGDKSTAYAWITDSNVDWFQNYTSAKNAASRALGSYSFNPPHLVAGNNVFTINKLAGVMRNFPQYAWIRKNLVPSGNFGKTLIWYSVDGNTFERFLDEARSVSAPKSSADICPPDREYTLLKNGLSPELGGSWQSPGLYTACLKVTEPSVLELRVVRGYGAFGLYPNEMNCLGEEAGNGESLWFKVPPGIYPICANVMVPGQAMWIVRRGRVELALRNQS